MAITVDSVITNLNTYIGDSSNDRITAAERLQFVTEATVWLKEQLQNDHEIKTYVLPYVDTVNYYKVTTPLADLLEGADLRRPVGENTQSMTHKSSRELAEEIAVGYGLDDSWAIERGDDDTFLVLNVRPKNIAFTLEDFDTQNGVDKWSADTVNSDALNITRDEVRVKKGLSSLNFDVDVSQSGNNRATITSSSYQYDLSNFTGRGVFLLDADIPDVTNISSFTLFWGNDSSNYWSTTVTTDLDGSPLADGFNTLAFEWQSATMVGSVDDTDITYFRVDVNYGALQVDDTDFRYDNFRVANSEELTFRYVSWDIGTDTTGATERTAFTATTDIPYFSGKYDQYKYAVAHKAASLAFYSMRLRQDAEDEEKNAFLALDRAKKIFPKSATKEIKTFKVRGIRLNK